MFGPATGVVPYMWWDGGDWAAGGVAGLDGGSAVAARTGVAAELDAHAASLMASFLAACSGEGSRRKISQLGVRSGSCLC